MVGALVAVVAPGGAFAMSFSNATSTPAATAVWSLWI